VRLLYLTPQNFRNLSEQKILFSSGVNIISGDNGQGKTNILEAVHFFKFAGSFRTRREKELIRFGSPFCRVEVGVEYSSGDTEEYSMSIDEFGAKKVMSGGGALDKLSDLVGLYPSVLFGPSDLHVVSGFPAERRKFLDMAGCMGDSCYLEDLRKFKRVLAQRNAALKDECGDGELKAWNEELIKSGVAVIKGRAKIAADLDAVLQKWTQTIMSGNDLELLYRCAVTDDLSGVEEKYREEIGIQKNEERRRRTTLVGPHRDNVELALDGKNARIYGSQGQKRLIAVLLRLSEMDYIEAKLKEPSILLLDDVFSELDRANCGRLMDALGGGRQLFITSPVALRLPGMENMRALQINDGRTSS